MSETRSGGQPTSPDDMLCPTCLREYPPGTVKCRDGIVDLVRRADLRTFHKTPKITTVQPPGRNPQTF